MRSCEIEDVFVDFWCRLNKKNDEDEDGGKGYEDVLGKGCLG